MSAPSTRPLSRLSPAVLRRLLAIFVPTAALLAGAILMLYVSDLSSERALHEQAGNHLVELHEDIINRELRSIKSDLLYLANQAVLRDFLSGPATRPEKLQDEYVLFCRQKGSYDQVRYLDTTGQEVIRVNNNPNGQPVIVARADLQSKADRYYFRQAMLLHGGEVFISPFDLNVEHGAIERPLKPVIRFATPVFDNHGDKRGVLVLNYLGNDLMGKLTRVSITYSGAPMLLNEAGYFLHGKTPGPAWGFMFGNGQTFARYYPEEWETVGSARHGRFHSPRGLFTFRAISPRAEVPADRRPRPPAEASDPDAQGAGLIIVSFVPTAVLYARSSEQFQRILLFSGAALVLVLVLAWYLAYAGALRRNHEKQIAESEVRLRKLSMQLLTAQEDERRSLSRDLHDDLGQVTTAVLLDLQRAGLEKDELKRGDLIQHALHGAQVVLERLHEIAARIRPTLLDDLGLKDAVQHFLSEYERTTGIVPRVDLRFERQDLPPAVSENVYRILQEALTNVAKHAHVPEVFVDLHAGADRVRLVVRDEGPGFEPEVQGGKGLGILGMRERAELLGGSFALQSQPGKGATIQVAFPIVEG
jgi:signal transduction histidine kinase